MILQFCLVAFAAILIALPVILCVLAAWAGWRLVARRPARHPIPPSVPALLITAVATAWAYDELITVLGPTPDTGYLQPRVRALIAIPVVAIAVFPLAWSLATFVISAMWNRTMPPRWPVALAAAVFGIVSCASVLLVGDLMFYAAKSQRGAVTRTATAMDDIHHAADIARQYSNLHADTNLQRTMRQVDSSEAITQSGVDSLERLNSLVMNRSTPPDTLAAIAAQTTQFDKYLLSASLPDSTRAMIVLRMSTSTSKEGRGALGRTPSTPPSLLVQLSRDSVAWVRMQVATNQATPIDVLRALAKDRMFFVRAAVASNPHTPKDVLSGLAGDEDRRVRTAAAHNDATPRARDVSALSEHDEIHAHALRFALLRPC